MDHETKLHELRERLERCRRAAREFPEGPLARDNRAVEEELKREIAALFGES